MSKKEIIKIDDEKDVVNFLQNPVPQIAKSLVGIFLDSGIREWKHSLGRVIMAAFNKKNLLVQLGEEIKYYHDKKETKENYLSSNKNRESLYELLMFIDEEVPDEERFNAMKSIFLLSISKDATKEDEVLAYEFMQICKKLGSNDILILKAAFDIISRNFRKGVLKPDLDITQASSWFKAIARQIGYSISELVEQQEEYLVSLKLITKRQQLPSHSTTKDTFFKSEYFRLTPLGYKLCEFITKYEKIKK